MNVSPKSLLNNQRLANIAQNTMYAVGIETALKAIGRPAFTLADKNTDSETKKYSATKEFLYQVLCFGIYMSVIPWFKKGGYHAAKRIFKDNKAVIDAFKEFDSKKIITKKNGKTKTIKGYDHFMHDYTQHKMNFEDEKITDAMHKIKGTIEGVSIIGSIIGLTVLAPLISHKIIHPVMSFIGLEKKPGHTEPEVNSGNQSLKTQNVDIKG